MGIDLSCFVMIQVFLIFSYSSLRKLLREDYPYRYIEIQKAMKYFFIMEQFGILSGVVFPSVILMFKNQNNKESLNKLYNIVWFIYPIS